jgi:hypothetical protein
MAPTAFLAGGREFVISLDDLAIHRLIGTGFLSPACASAGTLLGKYDIFCAKWRILATRSQRASPRHAVGKWMN